MNVGILGIIWGVWSIKEVSLVLLKIILDNVIDINNLVYGVFVVVSEKLGFKVGEIYIKKNFCGKGDWKGRFVFWDKIWVELLDWCLENYWN